MLILGRVRMARVFVPIFLSVTLTISHAKRTLIVNIIKIDMLSNYMYDRLQFKVTEDEIWVRYQTYLYRYVDEVQMIMAFKNYVENDLSCKNYVIFNSVFSL